MSQPYVSLRKVLEFVVGGCVCGWVGVPTDYLVCALLGCDKNVPQFMIVTWRLATISLCASQRHLVHVDLTMFSLILELCYNLIDARLWTEKRGPNLNQEWTVRSLTKVYHILKCPYICSVYQSITDLKKIISDEICILSLTLFHFNLNLLQLQSNTLITDYSTDIRL